MRKLSTILGLLVLVAIVAGGVLLMSWDIPPPTQPIEKVIPNARFQR